MFARLVEATTKPGKRTEVINILTDQLLPLLKRQPGFIDTVGLSDTASAENGITLSFWNDKDSAEKFYASFEFTKLMQLLEPLLQNMKVRTFNVETSTFHKLVAGKAA